MNLNNLKEGDRMFARAPYRNSLLCGKSGFAPQEFQALRKVHSLISVFLAFAIAILLVATGPPSSAVAGEYAATPQSEPETESQADETTGESQPVASNADPALDDTDMNFLTLFWLGGWLMIPLTAVSLIVVAISIERLITLRRERIFPDGLIRQLSQLSQQPGGLDPRLAYQICQQYPSAASNVFRAMLIKVGRPQSEIENAVSESSQRQANRLSQMGSWLGLAASIAPMLGLLGTVWGITQAFYDTTQLVAGQNRAEALAQGIYTALVTTVFGLVIAIPAAIMAHLFENRVVTLLNEIEEMIFNLMPQVERYEGKIRFTSPVPAELPPEQYHSGGQSADAVRAPNRKRTQSPVPD
jgi:biopolymer transport protein ExbB